MNFDNQLIPRLQLQHLASQNRNHVDQPPIGFQSDRTNNAMKRRPVSLQNQTFNKDLIRQKIQQAIMRQNQNIFPPLNNNRNFMYPIQQPHSYSNPILYDPTTQSKFQKTFHSRPIQSLYNTNQRYSPRQRQFNPVGKSLNFQIQRSPVMAFPRINIPVNQHDVQQQYLSQSQYMTPSLHQYKQHCAQILELKERQIHQQLNNCINYITVDDQNNSQSESYSNNDNNNTQYKLNGQTSLTTAQSILNKNQRLFFMLLKQGEIQSSIGRRGKKDLFEEKILEELRDEIDNITKPSDLRHNEYLKKKYDKQYKQLEKFFEEPKTKESKSHSRKTDKETKTENATEDTQSDRHSRSPSKTRSNKHSKSSSGKHKKYKKTMINIKSLDEQTSSKDPSLGGQKDKDKSSGIRQASELSVSVGNQNTTPKMGGGTPKHGGILKDSSRRNSRVSQLDVKDIVSQSKQMSPIMSENETSDKSSMHSQSSAIQRKKAKKKTAKEKEKKKTYKKKTYHHN